MAKKDLDIVKNEESVAETNTIDVSLDAIEKRRIRINGDNTKVIYLNLSDLNIVSRLQEIYPKLKELEIELSEFRADDVEDFDESVDAFSNKLRDVDTKMRECVNYIFDSDVCAVCAGSGSMYDPFDGKLRYEHIIEALSALYENNLTDEFKQIRSRISKHTNKYHK